MGRAAPCRAIASSGWWFVSAQPTLDSHSVGRHYCHALRRIQPVPTTDLVGSAVPIGHVILRPLGRRLAAGTVTTASMNALDRRHCRWLDDSSVNLTMTSGRDQQRPRSTMRSPRPRTKAVFGTGSSHGPEPSHPQFTPSALECGPHSSASTQTTPQARAGHSTVTLLARLRGLSTSVPRAQAV
jgi:hypothetical protein